MPNHCLYLPRRFDDRDQEKSAFSRRGTAFIGGAICALKRVSEPALKPGQRDPRYPTMLLIINLLIINNHPVIVYGTPFITTPAANKTPRSAPRVSKPG
jgi:hypothetical protein